MRGPAHSLIERLMRSWLILLLLASASAVTGSSGEDALFGDMPEVVGAAPHSQTLQKRWLA